MTDAATGTGLQGFVHEALFYEGSSEFLDRVVPFVRDGVDSGESVLVAVDAGNAALLQAELDGDASMVRFADMTEIGRNPARIIPAWREFVAAHPGRRLRGVGQPAWPGRTGAELDECALHESLLNLAFAEDTDFRLLCPYDTTGLGGDVLETARRNHPFVVEDGARGPSERYPGLDGAALPFGGPFPTPHAHVHAMAFGPELLSEIRRFVQELGRATGMDLERVDELVVAVNEVATNSLRYGGGGGMLLVWQEDGSLICEVRDHGTIVDPLVGLRAPQLDGEGGRGLWLVNHLCDLVQVRSPAGRAVVRMHMRLDTAA